MELSFLCKKKILASLKKRTIFALMFLVMKMDWFYQFTIHGDDKSHYVYIKDFDRFMFHKTKIKTKNTFVTIVYSILVVIMC